MRQSRWLVAALSTAGALGLALDGARAEGFVDAYFGGAFTEDAKQPLTVDGAPSGGGSGKFEDSVTVGGRVGYWLGIFPWLGFALDVSFFAPDEDRVAGAPQLELEVVPISPLVMFRAPLFADQSFPNGRVQPYAGIGPGIFVTDATLDLSSVGGPKISDQSVEVGVDLRTGVRFQLLEWLAIFGEYRFTHVEPNFEDSQAGSRAEIDTKLQSHHLNVGVGVHF